MAVFLHIFVKHPLTPRKSRHIHAYVLAKANLEGLLLAALESMEDEGGHDNGRLRATQGFLKKVWSEIERLALPCLNSPTSRRERGSQHSRSMSSVVTHVGDVWRIGEDKVDHLIPWYI